MCIWTIFVVIVFVCPSKILNQYIRMNGAHTHTTISYMALFLRFMQKCEDEEQVESKDDEPTIPPSETEFLDMNDNCILAIVESINWLPIFWDVRSQMNPVRRI